VTTTASSRAGLEGAFANFLKAHSGYERTRALDELRASEFFRLDEHGHVYLDYTGGGVYGDTQVRRHHEQLRRGVFGNPHSQNPTSAFATDLVEQCRHRVLRFFNASPDDYAVVFAANATHALKLVGEAYPFESGDQFLLTFDNHNSVNGIREFDRARGARTTYVPIVPPHMRVDEKTLDVFLGIANPQGHNLFAYPAQSNFSGVQHPLEWIARAQARGWDVLLDAAAFVPTNRLDLGQWRPDFVSISFYKMFGYPTGIGALIARWPALRKLHRPWFAGGTITVASVQADRYSLAAGSAAFEDGTLNYLGIPAVEIGLDFLDTVGLDVIHERVRCLAGWMIDQLLGMRHANGRPLVRLYGPRSMKARGGTVTVNLYDARGEFIDHRLVEERAARRMISLRTGCFCNPGAGEMALGLSRDELVACFREAGEHMEYEDFRRCVDGKSSGAVRVSVGIATNFADVHAFLEFVREFLQ
jgi:selenocysteine lyase/cysteine desulfurase